MQIKSVTRSCGIFCALVLLGFFINGCTPKSSTTIPPDSTAGLPVDAIMVETYGDIELPIEMMLEADKSMAMRTDSFQGGIHIYRGKVEISSLKDYIVTSMKNNKWKRVGEASTKNIMLSFTKPNKTCMVVLTNVGAGNLGKTQASFYVTEDLSAAKQLNPFGEPVNQ